MASSRVSGARLDALLQNATEPAFWLGGDLKLVWANKAFEGLTGRAVTESAGLVCQATGPTLGSELNGLGASLYPPAEALAGSPAGVKSLFLHPSGERRWRRIDFWPFHNEKGEVFAFLGLVRPAESSSAVPDSESHRLRTELLEIRDRLVARRAPETLVGKGPAHRRLLEQVRTAAAVESPVLVVGEPGAGKRHLARAIHQLGPRKAAPFLSVDVEALPSDVLERVLFGPQSQPDDNGPQVSRLVQPEGSTLLIGDAFELPRDLQGRLVSSMHGAVRIIGTTTWLPEAAYDSGKVRTDFFYQMTSLVVRLSPLRDRLEELPVLAQHFLERANLRGGLQRGGFTPEAVRALVSYDWPGNVRELARVVEEAQAVGDSVSVAVEHLPAAVRGNLASAFVPPPLPSPNLPLDELLTQVERRLIENVLAKSRGNKSRAAEMLGISRPRLYRRIRELGLPDEPEPAEDVAHHG